MLLFVTGAGSYILVTSRTTQIVVAVLYNAVATILLPAARSHNRIIIVATAAAGQSHCSHIV